MDYNFMVNQSGTRHPGRPRQVRRLGEQARQAT